MELGVHSEVGKLRKVLVCAPGKAHERLTPSNCDDLLFDDVMWVENAKRDHFDFILKMRERGIEVLEMHNMLAETVAIPEARAWILDHQVVPNQVGVGLVDEVRDGVDGTPGEVERRPRRLEVAGVGGDDDHAVPARHPGEHRETAIDADVPHMPRDERGREPGVSAERFEHGGDGSDGREEPVDLVIDRSVERRGIEIGFVVDAHQMFTTEARRARRGRRSI